MQNKQFKNLLPMRLQFFAEGGEGTGAEQGGANETPTMEQLMERIAALETANVQKDAEILQWKNSSDKASSQAADFKRQLTARMTAQEQADQAKKEADDALKNELATLRKKVALNEAVVRYTKIGMDEQLAVATATAEISGDFEGVSKNYAQHIEAIKAAEYQRFLKERPEINAGHGGEDDDPALALAKQLHQTTQKKSNVDILKNYF